MYESIRLGRIGGVEVGLHWSLLIIFLLIASSLALGLFPAWHPDWSAAVAWATALAAALLFLGSVLLHELSHAWMGRVFGAPIKRITLFIFGGMAHMEEESKSWRAEFWTAIIGPVTSLVIGLGCYLVAALLIPPSQAETAQSDPMALIRNLGPTATLLLWLGPINIILAAFNLVPGFPLDGGRVLRAVLWRFTGDLRKATRWAATAGQAFAMLLIACGLAMMLGLWVPVLGTGLVPGLWIAFIGWFLHSAAVLSYRQLVVSESLGGVPVERIMLDDPSTVASDVTLQTFVDDYLLGGTQRAVPAVDDGRLVGMVCLDDVRKVAREAWSSTRVADAMTPLEDLVTIEPDADASEALKALGRAGVNQLPVTRNGRLHGLLRREDVLKWLALYAGVPDETAQV